MVFFLPASYASQEVELDPVSLEKFQKDPAFDYYQPDYESKDRIRLSLPPHIERIGKFFLGCLVVVLLIWIIWRYRQSIFIRSRSIPREDSNLEESINRDDLEWQLETAIKEGRFNEAIRFRYLFLLRFLDRNQYIAWNIHKTTREYTRELKDPALRKAFSEASSFFQFYRYGNGVAGQVTYERFDALCLIITNRSWERK